MTYKQIKDIVEEIGLPYAYDHFGEGDNPSVPFVVFILPGRDDFLADNKPYVKVTTLTIELYTDYKDPGLEDRIDNVLESHGLIYDKNESWIVSEKLFETVYNSEVIYNANT